MNILLFYLEFLIMFWSFKYVFKFFCKCVLFLFFGLFMVVVMLLWNWQLCFIDFNVCFFMDGDFVWVDFVCISVMIVQCGLMVEFVVWCCVVGKIIVVGGLFFMSVQVDFLEVDYFVFNEVELMLFEFFWDFVIGWV